MKKTKKVISSKKTAKKTMTAKKTAAKKPAAKKTASKPKQIMASGSVSSTDNVVVVHPTEEKIASILESTPVAAAKTRKIKR